MTILTGRIWLVILLINITIAKAQKNYKLDTLSSGTSALIIGLDALDENNLWASGTNATILFSSNAGNTWETFHFEQADSLQFRAIKAISSNEALVMSAGEGPASQIFKFSKISGWKSLYIMPHSEGFLDAIEILPNGLGIAYGDAIDEQPFILMSDENLENWGRVETSVTASKGEGGFASSGSNITINKKGDIWIGTGAGGSANVLYSKNKGKDWQKFISPMIKGEAAGITSIRQGDDLLFITGGDLAKSDVYTDNLFISSDNGKSWLPLNQPITKGAFYGSAISNIDNTNIYLVCGPNGADFLASEKGKWIQFSQLNLWTAEFINKSTAILAGREGKMIKIEFLD
ncbi:hypothetical protein GCM10027429_10810 [Marivirga atlantica]|jgi:photosystem II stability/assembly factor-like uncharacterized protein|uniref:Oxidoreductase n=1 Tax=Marivirga atlantica TaxID=1548457 RepID=A0A937AFL1_9BACT|nr:hypothetical protein [Marivirga atlantica]MBL0764694.1 hypothetical protein [Marivirga atlantica]